MQVSSLYADALISGSFKAGFALRRESPTRLVYVATLDQPCG
jgi:hypothetical protein